MKKTLLFVFLIISSFLSSKANVITVPTNYSSIQLAIDASVDGDTIVVLQGTYFENINFKGKKILLTSLFYLSNDTSYISSTIINGSQPMQPDTNEIGEVVIDENYSQNKDAIIMNVGQLKRGIYFIKIVSSRDVITKKIVLK